MKINYKLFIYIYLTMGCLCSTKVSEKPILDITQYENKDEPLIKHDQLYTIDPNYTFYENTNDI